jgi:hypothetical protein
MKNSHNFLGHIGAGCLTRVALRWTFTFFLSQKYCGLPAHRELQISELGISLKIFSKCDKNTKQCNFRASTFPFISE